jgi:nitrogen fixation/metabolism regulation signal transduction histidine kinase
LGFNQLAVLNLYLSRLQNAKKNQDDLRDLCDDALAIMKIVQDQISAHGDTAATRFKGLCEDLER